MWLPLPAEAAPALFQIVSQRHLRTSIVLTTNRGVGAWGEICGDTTVAAAVLDRLLHRSRRARPRRRLPPPARPPRPQRQTSRHHHRQRPATAGPATATGWAISASTAGELQRASSPLAHLPSRNSDGNAAWLVLTAVAFNLTRTAGVPASTFRDKATTATIRTQLIAVPARTAEHDLGRR